MITLNPPLLRTLLVMLSIFMPPLLFPQQLLILFLIVLAVSSLLASTVFRILSFQTSSPLLFPRSVPGGHSGSPFSPLAPGSTIWVPSFSHPAATSLEPAFISLWAGCSHHVSNVDPPFFWHFPWSVGTLLIGILSFA